MKKYMLLGLVLLLLMGCESNETLISPQDPIDVIEITLPSDDDLVDDVDQVDVVVDDVSKEETETSESADDSTASGNQEPPSSGDITDEFVTELTRETVLWLQESLKIAGFYITRDGGYGPKTEEALNSFQKSMGLEVGLYNKATKTELERIREDMLAPDIGTDHVLINKNYYLPRDFVPADLREVEVRKNKSIELPNHVATVVEQMFMDAEADGVLLYLASGYRSYDYQEGIFSRRVEKNGFEEAERVVAIPGESEHQTGLAIDLTTEGMGFGLSQSFDEDEAFTWMMDNCFKYGFILRYLKGQEDQTGYIYEPWHYRYIGDVDAATEIMSQGIIYEVYLKK